MNILCQPHPDPTLYPKRAIFKFSAIDESYLTTLLPAALVQRLKGLQTRPDDGTIDTIVSYIEGGLRELSGFARLPQQPAQLRKAANDALLLARSELTAALRKAFARYPGQSAWNVLKAVAWAGVPCQDRTLQVTGQLSYVGLSAVATIDGGVSISTTGNAGVIGNLNVLGVKVGRLRGFLTVTDDQGNPDGSLCADLELSLGPVDLGVVKFNYRLGLNAADLVRALVAELAPYANDLFRPLLLEVIAPALREDLHMPADGQGDFDAARVLDLLAARATSLTRGSGGAQQIFALVERIFSGAFIALRKNPKATPQKIAQLVQRLVQVVYDAYNPEMTFCAVGEVKLFGFSLGKFVEVQGHADKQRLLVSLLYTSPITTTKIAAAFSYPNFYSLVIEATGRLLELEDLTKLPEKLEEIAATMLTRIARQMVHDAVIVFSHALSPLGLTLGKTAMRLLLPNVTHYPASTWAPPSGPGVPSRVQVLTAAVKDGVLDDVSWRGMPTEMAKLKLPEGLTAASTHLLDDFFPHGGLIGAGFLMVPSFLTEPPPVEEFATLVDGSKDLMKRGRRR